MNNDTQEPEAMRYDFDGFGWQYIDSGSGSDWQTRHPDAEALYASPSLPAQDGLVEALADFVHDIRATLEADEFYGDAPDEFLDRAVKLSARAGMSAIKGDKS